MNTGNREMFPDWLAAGLVSPDADAVPAFPLAPPPQPPLPDKLTPQVLRQAIIEALYPIKAYNLADDCVFFGLEPARENEDPNRSKTAYIDARVRRKTLAELLPVAEKIVAERDDRVLAHLLGLASGIGGVSGEMKNLIFAPAGGPKPKLVLSDAINNNVQLTENSGDCLVYDQPLAESGLSWRELASWWEARNPALAGQDEHDIALDLYARLERSLANDAEQFIFWKYARRYGTRGFDMPALIPQVYLHYDPYTRRTGGTLARQRMDFLLLLPRRRRIVLELDGIHHYANPEDGRADPARYAEMAAEDRKLRLAGYEVYRFGGQELADKAAAGPMLDKFFADLLDKPEFPSVK